MENESDQKNSPNGLYLPQLEKDACGVGFIADLNGNNTHLIVDNALTMLENMEHRGACGYEENTGDGAGMLVRIPFAFFENEFRKNNVKSADIDRYAVGMFCLPKQHIKRKFCDKLIESVCKAHGFNIFFSRKVPVDRTGIGAAALATEPDMVQLFLQFKDEVTEVDLEEKIYFLSVAILQAIYNKDFLLTDDFYIASLSSKTIIYKGQLKATQLRYYFVDLSNPGFTTDMAIVHSRFSTNTIPKWKLAQPFHCIAHNGEINTIQGNLNWWRAREEAIKKEDGNDWLTNAFPVCDPGLSDSGNFDAVVNFLSKTNKSITHALMMMIPEAWQNDPDMPDYKKDFYAYHDAVMEPWDGPAGICFTDGDIVGATLDRNGLRPARYALTADNVLILASEAGCLPVDPARIIRKGRLQPGEMLVADLKGKRILSDEELKARECRKFAYGKYLEMHSVQLDEMGFDNNTIPVNEAELVSRQIAFGFTKEDETVLLKAMSENGKEPIGSMGADIPLAVLSEKPQHIANYFKQQFAQVTNPPIDSLREKYFMSLKTTLGGAIGVYSNNTKPVVNIRIGSPLLDLNQYCGLAGLHNENFRTAVIDITYKSGAKMEAKIDRICMDAKAAAQAGCNLICLSDRAISETRIAVPSLLAAGAVHHALIESGKRMAVSVVVDAGDVWEVQHFATLLSFGADAICPRLAIESLKAIAKKDDRDESKLLRKYKSAVDKGLLKVMSKLGVSTLRSYKGAQTFEALGIATSVIRKCFKGTISRLEGMRFRDLQKEQEAKHQLAFGGHFNNRLPDAGLFQWKRNGEYHLFNPVSIHLLQYATKMNDFEVFKKFAAEIDNVEKNASTLRSLFGIKKGNAIPLTEVEPIGNILKRFVTGAMSFGSISHEAHTTLAKAMNRIGGKSNSGEGGEDERRFKQTPGEDWARSAIKQVASGRFGVTINYLTNADELQIKMAQGAKPGEGGQLPGHKVDENIARVRHATPGVGLISPPPHHDIYSIEDLAQLIFDLKNANRKARISVKLVAKTGVGVIASGVAKAHADHILISGYDGGTGASPLSSIRHAGLPWELGLSETHQTLVRNKLRDRVVLQCDGQIRTGRDMAIATMLGAEEWGIATAALVVEGCILMRKCHLNTCPVGIATQDKQLREKFAGKVEHLVNYFHLLAQDLREIMAACGVRTVNELVGRSDLLEVDKIDRHWKTQNLNLDKILYQPQNEPGFTLFQSKMQNHGLGQVLDRKLIKRSKHVLADGGEYHSAFPIKNTDRAVGTMLSNEIAKKYGSAGLPGKGLSFRFRGSAGQSFGAFLARGVFFLLEGESNDYFGKGLSGGKVVVVPDRKAGFNPAENIIVGNVSLYGATSGEAYIKGQAGDRFAVRNSGAKAVVEGAGDNACEYMTGGRVVVLGSIGKNFAAGMSGGIAYIYNPDVNHLNTINPEMVFVEKADAADLEEIRLMIRQHFVYTSSILALKILKYWETQAAHFVKIIPKEYKEVLAKQREITRINSIAI